MPLGYTWTIMIKIKNSKHNEAGFGHAVLIIIPALVVLGIVGTYSFVKIKDSQDKNSQSSKSTLAAKVKTAKDTQLIAQKAQTPTATHDATTKPAPAPEPAPAKSSPATTPTPKASSVPVLGWTTLSLIKEAAIDLPDGFKTESFGMDLGSLDVVTMSATGISNLTKTPGTAATQEWNGWLTSASGTSSDSDTSFLQVYLHVEASGTATYSGLFFGSPYSSITTNQGVQGRKFIENYSNMERSIKYQFLKDSRKIMIDYSCSKADAAKCLTETEVDKLAKSVFFAD